MLASLIRPLTQRQRLVDLLIAVGFLAATGFISLINEWGLLISVLMAVAVLFRRYSPAIALAVAWVGAITQILLVLPPLPCNLAIFAVLYTTAAYGTRVVFWAGFVSSILGAGIITVYLWAGLDSVDVFGLPASTIAGAIFTFVAWSFGLLLAWTAGALVRTSVRARETKIAQERAERATYAEQERVRIARDMHDVVAHSLAVVIAQADGARYAAAANPEVATEALTTISSTARAALTDVRLLLAQLRHSETAGPQPTIADLEALYSQVRAAGVDLRVDVDPAPPGVPPAAIQLAVYRILQEALTNSLRHGDGGPVYVRLSWLADRVDLSVQNGINAQRTPSNGHGLIGMSERASLVGGSLNIANNNGVFTVTATLPIGVAP